MLNYMEYINNERNLKGSKFKNYATLIFLVTKDDIENGFITFFNDEFINEFKSLNIKYYYEKQEKDIVGKFDLNESGIKSEKMKIIKEIKIRMNNKHLENPFLMLKGTNIKKIINLDIKSEMINKNIFEISEFQFLDEIIDIQKNSYKRKDNKDGKFSFIKDVKNIESKTHINNNQPSKVPDKIEEKSEDDNYFQEHNDISRADEEQNFREKINQFDDKKNKEKPIPAPNYKKKKNIKKIYYDNYFKKEKYNYENYDDISSIFELYEIDLERNETEDIFLTF